MHPKDFLNIYISWKGEVDVSFFSFYFGWGVFILFYLFYFILFYFIWVH